MRLNRILKVTLLMAVGCMSLAACKGDDGPEANSDIEEILKDGGVPSYSVLSDLLSKNYKQVEESLVKFGYSLQSRSPQNEYVKEVRVNMHKRGEDGEQLYYEYAYYYKTGQLKYIGFEYDEKITSADKIVELISPLVTDQGSFATDQEELSYVGSFAFGGSSQSYYDYETQREAWNAMKGKISNLPTDRRYSSDGLWVKRDGSNADVGLTDFVRYTMGNVSQYGYVSTNSLETIESVTFKAGDYMLTFTGDMEGGGKFSVTKNAPLSGIVTGMYTSTSLSPAGEAKNMNINTDPYGKGKLLQFHPVNMDEYDGLMDAGTYYNSMAKTMTTKAVINVDYKSSSTQSNFTLTDGELILTKRISLREY